MKTRPFALTVVASLAVGFGCGWLVAQVQNFHKITPEQVWVDEWIDSVSLLTGGALNTTFLPPEKTQSIIESGLNAQSLVVGSVYDRLPPPRKRELMFYIPAARAIATAQQEAGMPGNQNELLTFVNCMQKIKLHDGLMKRCIKDEHK